MVASICWLHLPMFALFHGISFPSAADVGCSNCGLSNIAMTCNFFLASGKCVILALMRKLTLTSKADHCLVRELSDTSHVQQVSNKCIGAQHNNKWKQEKTKQETKLTQDKKRNNLSK